MHVSVYHGSATVITDGVGNSGYNQYVCPWHVCIKGGWGAGDAGGGVDGVLALDFIM